jgi:hypothetical protein
VQSRCEAEIKTAAVALIQPARGCRPVYSGGMLVRPSALLCCLLLAGCAMPVREQPLREGLDPITTLQWRGFVDEKLRGQVMLGELKGSDPEAVGYLQKTLERVWSSRAPAKPLRDAMEEQLHELRLLANAALPARYALDAEILSLAGGQLPLSSEGEIEVRYRLREVDSGRLVYERRLRSQGEIGYGLLWPPARQRAAKEAALRANLRKLSEELVRLRV